MKLFNSIILQISSCNDLFIQNNNLVTKPWGKWKGKVHLEQQS